MRVFIVLAILGSALAVPTNPGRIVGGEDTSVETYPFIASLQFNLFGIIWVQGCGGSLITQRAVLTAARCIDLDQPKDWRCVMGSSSRSGEGGIMRQINEFRIHDEYGKTSLYDADVAVLLLNTAFPLTINIQTIPVASSTTQLGTGLPVTVMGWGLRNHQGSSPTVLQHVQLNIIDQAACEAGYKHLQTQAGFSEWPNVTENMVCAGAGGKSACEGDTGGPVVFRSSSSNLLVAMSSWSYQCANSEYPDVMVRLPRFTDWIVTNANRVT